MLHSQEYFFVLKMNKGTLFLLFFVIVLGGGVAGGAFLLGGTESIVLAPRTLEQLILVNLEVEGIEYQVNVALGSSAYDAMVQAQEALDLSFEGTEFPGLGFFIEEINGLRQNPKTGKYWIYYINGVSGKVGISAYIIKAHDIISWKYEKEHE